MFKVVHDTPETIKKKIQRMYYRNKKRKREDKDKKRKEKIGEEIEKRKKEIDVYLDEKIEMNDDDNFEW